MFKSIERASVAIGVVDAEGREELEDLLFNGGVGRVEGRRQFSDILAVLDDVVESDARIHDAANRTWTLVYRTNLTLIQWLPICSRQ